MNARLNNILGKLLDFAEPNDCSKSYISIFFRLVALGLLPFLVVVGMILGGHYLAVKFPIVLHIVGWVVLGSLMSAFIGVLIVLVLREVVEA